MGCFVPDPAYTFLSADPLPDLFCVICQDTKLILRDHLSPESLEESVEDETPNPVSWCAGTSFARGAAMAWLRSESYSGRCPICHFEFRFKRCGHAFNPIKLYPETVLFVAELKTGDSGVPDACTICTSIERLEAATLLCKPLARTYYKLKREFDEEGSDESRAFMLKAKKVLDGVKEAIQPVLRRC
ncbi:hypothetical protein VTI28DRAFT_761 [Corynascus sepedonium]